MPKNKLGGKHDSSKAEKTVNAAASVQAPVSPMASIANEGQTLEQQRARHALTKVQEALQDNVNRKEFKSSAAGFPAMVKMNGLGQAAAFYFSQGETYRKLYDILSEWLTKPGQPYAGAADLLAGVTSQNMSRYRVAQSEALLLLGWVKKFTKAFVAKD